MKLDITYNDKKTYVQLYPFGDINNDDMWLFVYNENPLFVAVFDEEDWDAQELISLLLISKGCIKLVPDECKKDAYGVSQSVIDKCDEEMWMNDDENPDLLPGFMFYGAGNQDYVKHGLYDLRGLKQIQMEIRMEAYPYHIMEKTLLAGRISA